MTVLHQFEYGYKMNSLSNRCIFTGRFNPLHNGHLAVAHYIEERHGRNVLFEIPVNYPKFGTTGKLQFSDNLLSIIKQFRILNRNVLLSDNISYLSKAKDYPGASFVVGPDVVMKVVDPVNYFNSIKELIRHINDIRELGCKFFVFPRTIEQYEYGIKLPKILDGIATYMDDFRPIEISSSEIREELRKIDEARKLKESLQK